MIIMSLDFSSILADIFAQIIVLAIIALTSTLSFLFYMKREKFGKAFLLVKSASKISPEDFLFTGYYKFYIKRKVPNLEDKDTTNQNTTVEDIIIEKLRTNNDVTILAKPDAGKTRCAYEIFKKLPRHSIILKPTSEPISIEELNPPVRTWYLKKKHYILFLDDVQDYAEKIWISDILLRLKKKNPVSILSTLRTGDEFLKAKESTIFKKDGFEHLLHSDSIVELRDLTFEEGEKIAKGTGRELPIEFSSVGTPGIITIGWGDYNKRYSGLNIEPENTRNAKLLMKAARLTQISGITNIKPEILNAAILAMEESELSQTKITEAETLLKKQDIIGWDIKSRLLRGGGKVLENVVDDYPPQNEGTLQSHLNNLLQNLSDSNALFEMGVTFHFNNNLPMACKAYEKATEIDEKLGSAWLNWGTDLASLAQLIYSEDKEKGKELFNQAFEKDQKAVDFKPDKHEAWNNWGTNLASLAQLIFTEDKEKGKELFNQAFEKYQKAVDFKPDEHEAWNNWGNNLASLAQLIYTEDKENGKELFNQAFEKYQKAVDFKPDKHEAWYNWGTNLASLAQLIYTEDKENGKELFNQAFEKYQKAVDFKPDKHDAWYNWGTNLASLAQLIYTEDKENGKELFNQAFEKYQKAVDFKPDKHEAWYNWGTNLASLAQLIYTEDKENGKELFNQAFEKYQKAVDFKPDKHEAWNNWGTNLASLAQLIYTEDKENGKELFNQAFEKYQKAVDFKPDEHDAWYNWGTNLASLAQLIYTEDKEKGKELFNQAFEKYQKAVDFKPDKHEAWNNWGTNLASLAQLIFTEDKENGKELFNQAFEKYQKAVDFKPDKHEAWNNWGTNLASLAQLIYTEDKENGKELFNQAFEKYQKAVDFKPDKHEAWNNWGNNLASLAQLIYTEDKENGKELFNQAFEKYQKAVDFKPDKHEAWYNWGNNLASLAQLIYTEDEQEGQILFEFAEEKVKHALSFSNLPQYRGLHGMILLALEKIDDGIEEKTHAALLFALGSNAQMAVYELSNAWSHLEDAISARPTALKCGVALAVHLKLFEAEQWPDNLLSTLEENISSLDDRSNLLLNWVKGNGIGKEQPTPMDKNDVPIDVLLALLFSSIEKMEHE
jgi:Plant specific mitochondrial import receptor subunit TOM20